MTSIRVILICYSPTRDEMMPTSSRMTEMFTEGTSDELSHGVTVTLLTLILLPLAVKLQTTVGVEATVADDEAKCGSNGLPGAQTDATASVRQDTSAMNAITPVRSRPSHLRSRVKRNVPMIPVAPARPVHTPTTRALTPHEYM